jgi:hypothetical protein
VLYSRMRCGTQLDPGGKPGDKKTNGPTITVLDEILLAPGKHAIADCCTLIDQEVSEK